jgi:hypothetical protein
MGTKGSQEYVMIPHTYVEFDLGEVFDITQIKLWHYYINNRQYKDVVITVSDDANANPQFLFNNDKDNSLGLGRGNDDEYIESEDGLVISHPSRGRYVKFYSNGNNVNDFNHIVEVEIITPFENIKNSNIKAKNIILHRGVSSSNVTDAIFATDGIKNNDKFTQLDDGKQFIQYNLGQLYDIDKINLWHIWGAKYKDVIVQASTSPTFDKDSTEIIYNNDKDNSSGLGTGENDEYTEIGLSVSKNGLQAKYIRLYSNGSNLNASNHYSEVEVLVFPSAKTENIAKGKLITSNSSIASNLDVITNGITDNSNEYANLGIDSAYIELDFGKVKQIKQIMLMHYWSDRRTYNDVVILASENSDFSNPNVIFNNDKDNSFGHGVGTDELYEETPKGKWITMEYTIDARYLRVYSKGSNVNSDNQIVELEVYTMY